MEPKTFLLGYIKGAFIDSDQEMAINLITLAPLTTFKEIEKIWTMVKMVKLTYYRRIQANKFMEKRVFFLIYWNSKYYNVDVMLFSVY